MKKLFQTIGLLAVIVLIVNCSGSKRPEAVAEKFLKHMNNKEYAQAKELGTEATIQMLSIMEQFSTDVPVQEVEIKNMKCDIVEDIANCKYLKNGEEEEDIKLVKVDGNWKVDMP